DQYQRVADACRRALYRDDVATDIDVEEEVRDAIAAVGIEWDTPHGETPADLVDAIVNHTRPALAKATEQRNRYRLAWRSARRRARRYRAERDGTVWVHPRRQGGIACVGGTRVPVDNIAERHVTGDLADQLTEHREASGPRNRVRAARAARRPSPPPIPRRTRRHRVGPPPPPGRHRLRRRHPRPRRQHRRTPRDRRPGRPTHRAP